MRGTSGYTTDPAKLHLLFQQVHNAGGGIGIAHSPAFNH